MTLSNAQRGDSVPEGGGVADVSEADRDAMDARDSFWSMSGEIHSSPPCHAQRTVVCAERVIVLNCRLNMFTS